jgi:hypothetical protein|tara:strand:+ start:3359 stop:3574 length:216 start_codon:yes stop_codon:yes gene_type:complete
VTNSFSDDEEDSEVHCVITLDIDCARQIYEAVSFKLDKWPGGDPQEQINLNDTKTFFYGVYMELLFKNDRI